jgi:WD40 repeat protein
MDNQGGDVLMISDQNNGQSRPSLPDDDLIIAWLENQFPNDVVVHASFVQHDGKMVRQDKMGKVKFLQASLSLESQRSGGYSFLSKHVIIEVCVEGYVFDGHGASGGRWPYGQNNGLFAFDGKQLLPLYGSKRDENLSALFQAEDLNLGQADPVEVASFFNEIVGTLMQEIVHCHAHARSHLVEHALPDRVDYDREKASVMPPSVVGDAKDGWTIKYWCLRRRMGCSPSLPQLFEYVCTVSSRYELSCQEIAKDLESKYALAVWDRGEKDGVQYANPKRKYSDTEITALIAALQDDFIGTRLQAIEALAELNCLGRSLGGNSPAAIAIPSLIKCLSDKDKFDCVGFKYSGLENQLIGTLSQILKASDVDAVVKSAAPVMVPYLFDKRLRYSTMLALKHMRPDASLAPVIIDAIKMLRAQEQSAWGRHTISNNCRYDADWIDLIQLLAFLEPPAQAALPFLEEIVASDADLVTKGTAYKTLESILAKLGTDRDSHAVAFHTQILKSDKDPGIYLNSLSALTKVEPLPQEVWPALMAALSDPSPGVRLATVRLIDQMGPAASPLVAELLGFGKSPYFADFKCPRGYGQERFYKTIAKIDPEGRQTIPLMQMALADPTLSERAVQLLLRNGSRQCRETVEKMQQPVVYSVAFSPDGRTLAIGYKSGTIKLWDVVSSREIRTLSRDSGIVLQVAFSPDGARLASGSLQNRIALNLWDVASGREIAASYGQSMGGLSLAFSPGGETLASAGRGFTVKLWHMASAKETTLSSPGGNHMACAVAFSPDGRTLASGGQDFSGEVKLRPDGRLLEATGGAGAIKLWDVASGQVINTLSGGLREVRSLAFRPDGRTLASGGDSGIKLWDVASGAEIRTLCKTSGSVRVVAFSPDGQTLASTGYDGLKLGLSAGPEIKLWNVSTGEEIRTILGHPLGVVSLAFNRDGQILASGGTGGVKLWDVNSGRELCALAK